MKNLLVLISAQETRTSRGTTFIVFLGLLLLLFFRHPENFKSHSKVPGDFGVYHLAGMRSIRLENPYQVQESSPYKYSPSALIPLQLLPEDQNVAWIAFKIISVLLFTAALFLGVYQYTWKNLLLILAGVVLAWKGIIETLDYGQLEFFIFFTSILCARIFQKRPLRAGVIMGAMPWLKLPWLLLSAPYFLSLLGKDRKKAVHYFLSYGFSFLGFGLLLPFLFFGKARFLEWTQSWLVLLKVQPESLFLGGLNQSFWSTAQRLFQMNTGIGKIAAVLMGLVLIIFSVKLIFKTVIKLNVDSKTKHENLNPIAWITPWLIFMQLLNPLSWRWSSMMLVGVFFSLPSKLETTQKREKIFYFVSFIFFIVLFVFQIMPWKSFGMGEWAEYWNTLGLVTLYWVFAFICCV